MNFSQIDRLFGAPLNTIAKPVIPFKMQTWHWVAVSIVAGLALYGAYAIKRDYLSRSSSKYEEDEKLLFRL